MMSRSNLIPDTSTIFGGGDYDADKMLFATLHPSFGFERR